jgi:hypothetical protein
MIANASVEDSTLCNYCNEAPSIGFFLTKDEDENVIARSICAECKTREEAHNDL